MNIMTIVYIIFSIVILGLIVLIHELGHFIAGRLCGIGVVEFSIGFGPKLFGWTRKDIMYSVRGIPFGGYCKFVGEDEENPRPDAMNAQPVWKRIVTVIAGPLMNVLLAYIVAVIALSSFALYTLLPVVDNVLPDMPAQAAGFEGGDVIVSVNGNKVSYDGLGTEAIRSAVQTSDHDQPVMFVVLRGGTEVTIPVVPMAVETQQEKADGTIAKGTAYQIGIEFTPLQVTSPTFYIKTATVGMLSSLKNIVFKGEGTENLSGPVGIISDMSAQVTQGPPTILQFVILISLSLGVMNLLPLPALDGGRLVFLVVEGIRRKPVPPEKEGFVHAIGFVLLFGLLIVVTVKDVWNIILRITGKA